MLDGYRERVRGYVAHLRSAQVSAVLQRSRGVHGQLGLSRTAMVEKKEGREVAM
jgi:hypothetical protein